MASAPRQGRKGGKITASPAVVANDPSPSALSPGSQLPGATGFPSDPNVVFDFNLEALLGNKKQKKAAQEAGDSPATTAAPPAAPVTAESNVFKFDVDAIQQVAQGVVIGGAKSFRTDTHARKPDASLEDVAKKLSTIFQAQRPSGANNKSHEVAAQALKDLEDCDVLLSQRTMLTMKIATMLSKKVEDSKVLVVVPRYFEVNGTAEALRRMKNVEGGANDNVGEIYGQTLTGDSTCRLWVASAETALLYLHTQRSLAPFTHVVVPSVSRVTPLVSYFLWGLRERVFRHSPNLDASAPPLRLLLCVSPGTLEQTRAFFEHVRLAELPAPVEGDILDFSYDEASALAECDVLESEIDATGRFPAPHRKLVSHTLSAAVSLIKKLTAEAKFPQKIYLFTSDGRDAVEAIQTESIKDVMVFSGRYAADDDGAEEAPTPSTHHCVYVLHSVMNSLQSGSDDVNFVLDLGTTRRISNASKYESFIAGSASEWASRIDLKERRELLGEVCCGGYFTLYPPAAMEVMPKKDVRTTPMADIENALLQCSRADMPFDLASDSLVTVDSDTMEQVLHNLSEKCFIMNAQSAGLTFTGEMAARLPLEIDLAHLVINGCALGFGEASVLLAVICALPFRNPVGSNPTELQAWSAAVTENRKKYAGDIARQSDVLADALVYLEWCKLVAEGQPTDSLVAELQVKETRLEQMKTLMDYIRMQLSDYVFLDDFTVPRTVEAMKDTIKRNATILTFLEASALARRTLYVRESGNLKLKDRSGALVFVRTSKKVSPNLNVPSSVAWESGAVLLPVDVRSLPNLITAARFSLLSTNYLFASLLLLSPQLEYSDPIDVSGKGRVVYFAVTCNCQMKRFAVAIEEAVSILNFREKWNKALGYLAALRKLPHPISARRFEQELKQVDRLFHLSDFYTQVQREMMNLVTELEVTEHQGSFVSKKVHCLCPTTIIPSEETPALASDVTMSKRFHDGNAWRVASPNTVTSPATVPTKDSEKPAANAFPSAQVGLYIEEDDDDVEVIEESYFVKHGPIMDDDD
ncbi:ATP-dependent RNA helicase [Strigomonas culicis]|uniref:ATP-dependent RNA helicase n=1 Tax=Strigomonas culicis TaxID=28005 RepID=S9VL06_9TRYP|nr:ATP-dependent RNA helicase [Strigomonas culicis]|eukprot:EPY23880.1 ATP-dependent RNA helicase [Strigomonas culicis]